MLDIKKIIENQVNKMLDEGAVEKTIQETYSSDTPVKVIITPTEECNGIFLAEASSSGFLAKELMKGKSNATFNWIAIGRIKGYEKRPDIKPILSEKLQNEPELKQDIPKKVKTDIQRREVKPIPVDQESPIQTNR